MSRFPGLSKRVARWTLALTAVACLLCAGGVYAAGTNKIKDPSFELYDGSWKETSTHDYSVVCTHSACQGSSATSGPRTGISWAWLGGVTSFEKSQVIQRLKFPTGGSATLSFYLWIGRVGDAPGKLKVTIDGNKIANINYNNATYANGYVLVQRDVSQFADGQRHRIIFTGTQSGSGVSGTASEAVTNYNIDDVSITAN